MTGLFWEKSTTGWWLICQTNRAPASPTTSLGPVGQNLLTYHRPSINSLENEKRLDSFFFADVCWYTHAQPLPIAVAASKSTDGWSRLTRPSRRQPCCHLPAEPMDAAKQRSAPLLFSATRELDAIDGPSPNYALAAPTTSAATIDRGSRPIICDMGGRNEA
jgi:hypothetical protein